MTLNQRHCSLLRLFHIVSDVTNHDKELDTILLDFFCCPRRVVLHLSLQLHRAVRKYQVVDAGTVFSPGLGVFSPLLNFYGILTQSHLPVDFVDHLNILCQGVVFESFDRLEYRVGYGISLIYREVVHPDRLCRLSP